MSIDKYKEQIKEKAMTDESNTETLNKEIEEEVLKKVDQLCKDVFHRMIYGPSQEEE